MAHDRLTRSAPHPIMHVASAESILQPASGGDNGRSRSGGGGGGIFALAGLALLSIALLEAGHVALAHLSIARKEGLEVLRLHHRCDLDAVLSLARTVGGTHQQG